MFEEQCASYQVEYPFSDQHIDLRRKLQRQDKTVKIRQVGLAKALHLIGLEYEGTAHRGVDDACNTARLLAAMWERHGVEMFQI